MDYDYLLTYGKKFADLTIEKEYLIAGLGSLIKPDFQFITDEFYNRLFHIDRAKPFLEGKLENLKKTHLQWLHNVFFLPYDVEYVTNLYKIGETHARLDIPIEFMSGSTTILNQQIMLILPKEELTRENLSALYSAFGFNLFIMELSYTTAIELKLEKFLTITGINKTLYKRMSDML